MNKDIFQYLRSCETSKAQKSEQRLPHDIMTPRQVSCPWEIVCTDITGRLPLSQSRNRFTLVISDLFTKYFLPFPLKTASTSAIVRHLENDFFLGYGVFERLICDNGRQYISNKFKAMANSYDCKIVYNAQESPSANTTERVN